MLYLNLFESQSLFLVDEIFAFIAKLLIGRLSLSRLPAQAPANDDKDRQHKDPQQEFCPAGEFALIDHEKRLTIGFEKVSYFFKHRVSL